VSAVTANDVVSFSLLVTSSRWLGAYLLLVYTSLVAALWYLPLAVYYQIPGLIVLLVCCYRNWLARTARPGEILCCHHGRWTLVCGGVDVPIELRQITVWPGLIVLNYRSSQSRWQQSLALFPDSAEAESLRQLRVVLRHMAL
jgi:hypothetical protein